MDSKGGHIWPARPWDTRWTTLLGGPATPDDILAYFTGLGYVGTLDDMWLQYKEANGITDTSQPFDGLV